MSTFFAMAAFSLVMSISPGPVNIVTLSIGANSGYRKALPFVSGATIGFTLLLLLVGTGLGKLVMSAPYFMQSINIIGTLFICYIGLKIARSDGNISTAEDALPGFTKGFLLQWLNPKAWIACLAGVALFSSPESANQLYVFVTIYFVVCFFGILSWAILGEKALTMINSPKKMRIFNTTMGLTLITVALYMLYQQLQSA